MTDFCRVPYLNTFCVSMLSLLIAGCVAESDESSAATKTPEVVESTSDRDFDNFERQVHKEVGTGFYVVENDIVIPTREGLLEYYNDNYTQSELILDRVTQLDNRLTDARRLDISYCVSMGFGADRGRVIAAMAAAAKAWETYTFAVFHMDTPVFGICNSSNEAVYFDVSPSTDEAYDMRAFYPNASRNGRSLLINMAHVNASTIQTMTGMATHELGHILGFRHEHIRPEAGASSLCREPGDYRALSTYDSASIMHYPGYALPACFGTNVGDYALTSRDKLAAGSMYGYWAKVVDGVSAEPGETVDFGRGACSFEIGVSGNWHSGNAERAANGLWTCYIENGGTVQSSASFRLLRAEPTVAHTRAWKSAVSTQAIPSEAMWAGLVSGFGNMYVCRALINGGLYAGKLFTYNNQSICAIGVGTATYVKYEFDVLVDRSKSWLGAENAVLPGAAFVGYSSSGVSSFVCSVDVGAGTPNTHIGALTWDGSSWQCHIGNGGTEQVYPFYKSLVGGAYSWGIYSSVGNGPLPSSAVWGGWAAGVGDMYVCRAGAGLGVGFKRAGKMFNAGNGWLCSVGNSGSETVLSNNYEIMLLL